ncbi:uncharacterized protein LOC131845624 [Achroia grisella]|uniref:uncharacterized protein LOC131845624 n=1 Tax=Achroia grisella TaxID=688607 RepID=UPI0027D2585B|nr:uncharacterized protein LOC131845624 [Achroia grisella]
MEGLLNIQEDRYQRLCKSELNYKKSPKDRITNSYLNTRLDTLEKLWKDFQDTHQEIVTVITTEKRNVIGYFKNDIYDKFEENYINYKSSLQEVLQTKNPVVAHSMPVAPTTSDVKLPCIQLPTFSGKYNDWQSFFDMFSSVVHNNKSLSSVQKLHYLKGSLSGEAEGLLRNLPTTELNYEIAWTTLTKRYNNKRYNCNAILKALFSQKHINVESAPAIKSLLDTTSACLISLNNLGIATSSWDAMVVYLVTSRLDHESLRQWETRVSVISSDTLPTWKDLMEFLESRFRTLEIIDTNKHATRAPQQNIKQMEKFKSFAAVQDKKLTTKQSCVMCAGDHLIFQCKSFGHLLPRERQDLAQSKGLCFNCLAPTHTVRKCRQSTCCRRCGRRHHSLLHLEKENNQGPINNLENTNTDSGRPTLENTNSTPDSEVRVVANFAKENEIGTYRVLLATAVVRAYSRNGQSNLLRVLIDQGSQASFVTEETVQLLGLKRTPVNGCVSGLGDGQLRIKHMVSFRIESQRNSNNSIQITAYVLKSLTSRIPCTNVNIPDWLDIEKLSLADAGYTSPGRIDVLLGAEVYSEILLSDMLKHPQGHMLAQNTIFGWVISGRVSQSTSVNEKLISLHIQIREDTLLKQFWELENEPNTIKKKLTKTEEKCEEIYELTTRRNDEGRFVVKLPLNREKPECENGKLKDIAQKRFHFLERKFQKNPAFKEEYNKVILEYLDLNHMVRVSDDSDNCKAVYFPHHAVVREDKETTKLRVVFDASCKGVNGVSLNDNLLVGPKLQQDLRYILMRWRKHRICIVADIIKMYRQVRVRAEDTRYQRIVWRSNPDEPIGHYELLTLTFGTACAPYLAVKSLQRLADEEQHNFPIAAEITKRDFYVDDLMTGCETEDKAEEIYKQLNQLLNSGGFQLQKWNSNSSSFLQFIGQNNQDDAQSLTVKSNSIIKVLGIRWHRDSDKFQYIVKLPELSLPVTKRKVLSTIASLYDPMGWIAPVVIVAKIFIQKLWKSGLPWDNELTEDLLTEWLIYREELINLEEILIPRWLQYTHNCKTELHAFADASQSAYAAVVYLRVIDNDGRVYVHLVTAKTKVAPIEKQLSIPRLELCGAALAAKLLFEVSQIMEVPKENLYAWSDSTVVLAWLRGLPSRWTTFVSNRVSEILNIIDSDQYRHVDTKLNPADCASRGLQPSELKTHTLWWNGPIWLHEPIVDLPIFEFATKEEEKVSKVIEIKSLVTINRKEINRQLIEEEIQESEEALMICIKQVQHLYFSDEMKQLQKGSVFKRSEVYSLNPFLDEKGILRVGGRIHLAKLNYNERHPIIMPEISHLTQVIIMDAHNSTMHSGPQTMLNYIRSRFFIIRARKLVKKHFRKCITCLRYAQRKNTPLMGQLPEVRLQPSKPFKSAGVDYAGPINIKFSPGRGAKSYKGYVCLFICMVTRAIHLEAVSDLTAKGFIAAFRRFVGRRGFCMDLYSDNGTNFVGADKELRQMFDEAKSRVPQEIAELLALQKTTWHYIPPYSPNFGGLWEAAVRSTKLILRKVIGESTLTYEELSTVLIQIEACLNSRPLSQLSDDPSDPLPLTPGHFLVGEPIISVVDNFHYNQISNVTGLERWRLVQKMINDFWNRWSKDYLLHLDKRYKWSIKRSEPDIDDIVIVREENLPPTKWILGRIVEKHAGKDNITRVVTLKCKDKLLKRPVNKLCFLPKK